MKERTYLDFFDSLHRQAKKARFPLRVMFELTYRCNFRCGHCYIPESYKNKQGELKTKEVFLILDQLAEIGCVYIGFTGGEPFMRKDIFDVLWYARKKGLQAIIYTNGYFINKKKAAELARLHLNKIDITIPAMKRGEFEGITGFPGSHEKVFEAIRLLHDKGVKMDFKTCVLKTNSGQLKDIRKFADSLGARHRVDDLLFPKLDRDLEPYSFRDGSFLDIKKFSCALNITAPKKKTLFSCGAGKTQAAVNPFGRLKMCLLIEEPSFRILEESGAGSGGLKEGWGKIKKYVSGIAKDSNYKCGKCRLYDYCKWCPARSWLRNQTFTACDPESFRKAKMVHDKDKC